MHTGYLANYWLLEAVSYVSGLHNRKLFYGVEMDKNIGHDCWLTVKYFKITQAKMLYNSPKKQNL